MSCKSLEWSDGAWSMKTTVMAIIVGLQAYVVIAGLLSFVGWAADLPWLTDWNRSGISIQPNTTLAATLAGAGLIFWMFGYCRVTAACGSLVTLVGGSVLFEYITGVDLGIDTLLTFDREWGRVDGMMPGRMGPLGAIAWTCIGVALMLASKSQDWKGRRFIPWLGLATASIASLSLIGYLYGASGLYTIPDLTIIALQTATFILAVSLGLMLAVPEYGPMRLVREDGPGAILIRRTLPILIAIPILLGFIRLIGERFALYDGPFGSALRTLAEIALFLVLLWRTGVAINRQERRRREADEAMKASQQRVVDTLERITDGFVALDRSWRVTYLNAEAEHLLGKSYDELLGKNVWEAFPEAVNGKSYKELHRAALTRTSVEFEDFNPVMQRWFANKAYPAADGGVSIYFEDITPRKQAEMALLRSQQEIETELNDTHLLQRVSGALISNEDVATLFESIVDAAATLMRSDFGSLQMLYPDHGKAGELRLLAYRGFSPEAARHWEWIPADSSSVCGTALRARERVVVTDVVSCDFLRASVDLPLYRQASIRAIQSTPLISRGGKLVGMISTHWRVPHEPLDRDVRLLDILARQAADLIERKDSETAREQALEREHAARVEAERALRLKDEFLATVSHELRTPLSAILGWSYFLKKDIDDPLKARYAAEVIERNGQLQAQLISDLLDMSRIMAGKMRLNVQRVDLPRVINAAIESVAPAADAKGVRIDRAISGALANSINGDPDRLQQVVWNLLSNAVKFTSKGGEVSIVAKRVESHVEIRVSDTGKGISPDFLPYIFDRFRQADTSASRAHGGLGIGLALVKELIELHGGQAHAASGGQDQGATFIVELPIATVTERRPFVAARATASEELVSFAEKLNDIKVLVVDDEPDVLEMACRALEESGAVVRTARSCDEGIDALEVDEFDVIVSDIGMPLRDGYVFITEARSRGVHTPAMALTAFARPDDRKKSIMSGYQAHISKPVSIGQLLATVASLARQSTRAR
jgi:PAS domain S-box-containing protein